MEVRETLNNYLIRLTDSVDEESRTFEAQLRTQVPEIPWMQTVSFLELARGRYYLLQIRLADGTPCAQVVIRESRSRLPVFAVGVVERFPCAVDGAAEELALSACRELCRRHTTLMELRVQPYRLESEQLGNFEERARRSGFRLTEPTDVTRTRVLDLTPSEEELLAALPRKTRYCVKTKDSDPAVFRPITDMAMIPALREALNASFSRSTGDRVDFDFETTIALARKHPDRARLIGLFLKSRPEHPVAYVTGFRSDKVGEYSSAGSVHDPELRSYPFNYVLLWDLILWAKRSGATTFDLRGITSGDESDPLAGISFFKRRFPGREIEVNRDMTVVLRPELKALFLALHGAKKLLRRT